MSKPHIHAQSSVRKYGGKEEDYLAIHQHMDSTKGCIADNRHKVLTHNSWYISANQLSNLESLIHLYKGL